MFNLFFALFRAPWWVFVGLAVLLYYGGGYMYEDMKAEREARLTALEGPVPPVVDLSDFSKHDIPTSDEVHLKGWVNLGLNHHLTVTRKGRVTGERRVFVLFGSDDAVGSKTARAALFFTNQGREQFLEQLDQYVTGFDGDRPLIQVNGFGGEYESFEGQLEDALAEKGVKLGPDFIAIHPFLNGREQGLSSGGDPDDFKNFGLNAALFMLVIAVVKLLTGLRRRKSRDEFADSPIASSLSTMSPQPTGTTTGAEMPKDMVAPHGFSAPRADAITDDSPLGRMQRRDQALRGLAADPVPPGKSGGRSFDFTRERALPSSGLWEKFKKSIILVLTGALILIWAGNKLRILDLGEAGDIMRWAVTGMVIVCIGFGGWFLMTRDDFAGGNPTIKIAAGLGGLFLLGQVQAFLGAPVGGVILMALLPLAAMFLLWAFVIRRFVSAVGQGVDRAASAAVKAKMKADPFEKLGAQNASPIQSSR